MENEAILYTYINDQCQSRINRKTEIWISGWREDSYDGELERFKVSQPNHPDNFLHLNLFDVTFHFIYHLLGRCEKWKDRANDTRNS